MKVAIRAEASPEIGGGHLMRCMSLAEALVRRGAEVTFQCSAQSESFADRRFKGLFSWDLENDSPGTDCDVVIFDGYHFGITDFRQARADGARVMVIDDLAEHPLDVDLVLNQNLDAHVNRYDGVAGKSTALLMGPDYALVRRAFAEARQNALVRCDAASRGGLQLLLQAGLTDPNNVLGLFCDAIASMKNRPVLSIHAVIGAQAPHLQALRGQMKHLEGEENIAEVAVHTDLSAEEMAERMVHADLALSAGGSANWERCTLGLPSILVCSSRNQEPGVRAMEEAGGAIFAGLLGAFEKSPETLGERISDLLSDDKRIAALSKSSASLCDGLGAPRVALALFPERDKQNAAVSLRRVRMSDCEQIYKWQSNPDVRKHFRNPDMPDYETHQAWMMRQLDNHAVTLEMIEVDGVAAGVLRLDPVEERAGLNQPVREVSIYLAPEFWGRGVGQAALRAMRLLAGQTDLFAFVKAENQSSRRMFEAVGFKETQRDQLVLVANTKVKE